MTNPRQSIRPVGAKALRALRHFMLASPSWGWALDRSMVSMLERRGLIKGSTVLAEGFTITDDGLVLLEKEAKKK